MSRAKSYLHDLGTAFENLFHALITPRQALAYEIEAQEFCVKMRALGIDPSEALNGAAMAAACGMSHEEMLVFAKMSAQRSITSESLNQLIFNHGYSAPFKMTQWREA